MSGRQRVGGGARAKACGLWRGEWSLAASGGQVDAHGVEVSRRCSRGVPAKSEALCKILRRGPSGLVKSNNSNKWFISDQVSDYRGEKLVVLSK